MRKLLFFTVLFSIIFIFSGCVVSEIFNNTENDIYTAFTDSFIQDNSSFEEFLTSDVFYTKKFKSTIINSFTETNIIKAKEFITILRDLGAKYSSEPYSLKENSRSTKKEAGYSTIVLEYIATKSNSPEKVFLNFELYYKNFNEGKISNNYRVDTVNLTVEQDMLVSSFFEGGEGTETSPYLIADEKQLDYMRYFVDSNKEFIAEDVYFQLTDDIDLAGVSWSPVGSSDTPFAGNFDGNGFSIYNLSYDNSSFNNFGLFGFTNSDAVIKSVALENVNISANENVGSLVGFNNGTVSDSFSSGIVQGSESVGGLIGRNNGSVSNVFSNVDLSGVEIEMNENLVFEGENIGGIVGYNSKDISNSYFVGSINGTKNTGGISGLDSGNIVSSYYSNSISGLTNKNGEGKYVSELKMKSTFVDWDFDNVWNIDEEKSFPSLISFEDIVLSDEFSVSGFIKDFDGKAIDNVSIEIYSVQKDVDDNFVPDLSKKITYSVSNTEGYWAIDNLSGRVAVVPKNSAGSYFYPSFVVVNSSYSMSFKFLEFPGGEGTETSPYLIADEKQLDYMRYFVDSNKEFIAEDVYFQLTDDIDLAGVSWSPVGSSDTPFAGNFDGNGFSIYNLSYDNSSFNNFGLFGFTNSDAIIKSVALENVNISANENVGSLVGFNNGTVSDSFSSGIVQGSESVGGLIGRNNGSVSKSYYLGDVKGYVKYIDDSGSTIEKILGEQLGGFIGYNSGSIDNSFSKGFVEGKEKVGGFIGFNNGAVENSYSAVEVFGDSRLGGFVGDSISFDLVSCYYDKDLLDSSLNYNNFANGETTTNMKNETTFSGWDFTNIWIIDNNYPELR